MKDYKPSKRVLEFQKNVSPFAQEFIFLGKLHDLKKGIVKLDLNCQPFGVPEPDKELFSENEWSFT